MKTLDKIEYGSNEYDEEVQRENAYYFMVLFDNLTFGLNLSSTVRERAKEFFDFLCKEIGNDEFTVGLDDGEK